jgi:hypothetical protein
LGHNWVAVDNSSGMASAVFGMFEPAASMNGYASDLLGRLIETSSVGRPFAVCACQASIARPRSLRS